MSGERSCPGCGWTAPRSDGPTHAYIGASPECWARYGLLLTHGGGQQAVDAYAVQHPGVDGRRSRQSVAAHLISLCAALEHPATHPQGPALLRLAVRRPDGYPWLTPPDLLGGSTVDDVLRDAASVDAWARQVWERWGPHHATVGRWWEELTSP